ncbi:MAG: uL15 family ribosomal protein, partial [Candidatus Taylorbacteria bacterium]|nr:uL15 family ribosomal protein [Candidatus Taylorbacteria bacterium]
MKSKSRKRKKTVGRGGKRGKTSGRGTKGQKARAGRKIRPEVRDFIKRVPKLRGYRFKGLGKKSETVPLTKVEKYFSAGETVTPSALWEKGLIKKRGGVLPPVAILA